MHAREKEAAHSVVKQEHDSRMELAQAQLKAAEERLGSAKMYEDVDLRGHSRFDGDESDGDSFRRSSEVQEQKLGGGGRSSFFRRSSEVREVGR